MSLEEKILEREIKKIQLENKALKELLQLRISYEARMVEKTIKLCELMGIPIKEAIEFYDNKNI